MRRLHFLSPVIMAGVLAAGLPAAGLVTDRLAAQTARMKPEKFSALAANISNVGSAGITPLDIRIDRWTTDAENDQLLTTLRDKGQDAFLRALTSADRVGSIATPASLRYDFYYARQTPAENGRQIMMITDRPMLLAERMQAAPSREYPFTVLQMTLDKEGRGQGMLMQLVQLRLLGDILGIENLASGPIKLNEIRPVR